MSPHGRSVRSRLPQARQLAWIAQLRVNCEALQKKLAAKEQPPLVQPLASSSPLIESEALSPECRGAVGESQVGAVKTRSAVSGE